MNKKERRLALATAIQSAAVDMIVVENLDGKLPEKKTKAVVALLEKVLMDGGYKMTVLSLLHHPLKSCAFPSTLSSSWPCP